MSQMSLIKNETTYGANLSPCRKYRYSLWREWNKDKETCVFIGLNPSTADESEDDPTIRRCIRFAKDWGFGKLVMINLFALRATDPEVMKANKKPIGDANDDNLKIECKQAGLVVAAWGNNGSYLDRSQNAVKLLAGVNMKCFKITAQGQPIHPLYQAADSILIEYKP